MPNPWDIKLVSELSEGEMLSYVNHLEAQDTFGRAAAMEKTIEHVVEFWRRMRAESPSGLGWGPYQHISMGPTHGFIGELGTSPIQPAYQGIYIKVYPWMDEKHVRYLAREQLMEYEHA